MFILFVQGSDLTGVSVFSARAALRHTAFERQNLIRLFTIAKITT